MKKKLLFLTAVLLIAVFALAACDHVHSYAENWSKDDECHWREVTCEHSDAVLREAHKMQPIPGENGKTKCEVCGYIKTDSTPSPNPDGHKHTFAESWSKDGEYHWHAATCEHASEVADKAKHTFDGGICNVCGAWSKISDVISSALKELDVWNYTLVINDAVIPIGDGECLNVSGEMKFDLDSNCGLVGIGNLALSHKSSTSTRTERVDVSAVVEDGTVYLMGIYDENFEDRLLYIRSDLSDFLGSADIDVDAVKEAVKQMDENTLVINAYFEQLKPMLDEIKIDGEIIGNIVKTLFVANADKTVYTLNFSVLKDVNNLLAETTFKDYVDSIFGEGFFDAIPQTAEAIMDITVGELLKELEKHGVTVDDVVSFVNAAIKEYYPDPDVNTIIDLIKKSGVTLPGGIVTEADIIKTLKPLKIGALLESVFSTSSQPITQEQILAQISALCKAYGNLTAYDLLAQKINSAEEPNVGPSVSPMSEQSPQITANAIRLTVDRVADLLQNFVKIEFNVKDGQVTKVAVNFAIPHQSEEVYTDAEPTVDEIMADALVLKLRELLSMFNIDAEFTRGFESSVDYSKIAETVNAAYAITLPQELDDEQINELMVNSSLYDVEIIDKTYVEGVLKITCRQQIKLDFYADSGVCYTASIPYYVVCLFDLNEYSYVLLMCKDKYFLEINSIMHIMYEDVKFIKTQDGGVVTEINTLKEFLDEVTVYCADAEESLNEFINYYYGKTTQENKTSVYFDAAERKFVSSFSDVHTLVLVPEKCEEGTACGETTKTVYKCLVCGKEIVNYTEKPHDFSSSEERIQPLGSCCEDGVAVYMTCGICKEEILLLKQYDRDHSIKEQTIDLSDFKAACVDHSVKLRICENCGKVIDFVFINGRKVADSEITNQNIADAWVCSNGDCALSVIEYMPQIDKEPYSVTRFTVQFVDTLIYDGEAVRYSQNSYMHRHEYTFHYSVDDNTTCVNGVDVYTDCGICRTREFIGTYNTHFTTKISVEKPDGCCSEHIMNAYICQACNLCSGFAFDDTFQEAESSEEDVYVYVCSTCGLKIVRTLGEKTPDGYFDGSIDIYNNNEHLAYYTMYTYDNGTSYPTFE